MECSGWIPAYERVKESQNDLYPALSVIPAQAGIQMGRIKLAVSPDSRLRGNDGERLLRTSPWSRGERKPIPSQPLARE